MVSTSCWNQQGHDASGPELPNYTVSGTVYRSDNNEPLPGATVRVDTAQTTTDSAGQYSISHVIGGSGHSLSISRAGYISYNSGFQLGYADLDSLDAVLGKILYFTAQIRGAGIEPNGLAWVDDQPWASCGYRRRMYVLDEAQGLSDVKYVDPPGSFPQKDIFTIPYGITATEEGGEWFLWISVAFDNGSTYVYQTTVLSDTTLSIKKRFDTPESVYGPEVSVLLDDLTYDGTYIWSCSARERRVYKHGPDMSVLSVYDFLDMRPKGIAWSTDILWMTTDGSDELYMLSGENLEPRGYYALVNAPVVGLLYRDGYVWGCKHGSQNWPSYFYTYRVD